GCVSICKPKVQCDSQTLAPAGASLPIAPQSGDIASAVATSDTGATGTGATSAQACAAAASWAKPSAIAAIAPVQRRLQRLTIDGRGLTRWRRVYRQAPRVRH